MVGSGHSTQVSLITHLYLSTSILRATNNLFNKFIRLINKTITLLPQYCKKLKHLILPVHLTNQTSYPKKCGNFHEYLWVRHRKHSVKDADITIAIDSQVAEPPTLLIAITEDATPAQVAAPCTRHGMYRENCNENQPKKTPASRRCRCLYFYITTQVLT